MDSDVKLRIAEIEHLPNYQKKTATEYSSSCPVCGGEDRFLFWPENGNYWCRVCGLSGWVTDNPGSELFRVTPEMRNRWEEQKQKREQQERERYATAVKRLQEIRPDLGYQKLMSNPGYITYRWGLSEPGVSKYGLGYCDSCPTYLESCSITIPYYWKNQIINLRHRLLSPNGSGKYRPEMAGLPTAIYNADRLIEQHDTVTLVEGEFKAMVIEEQTGLPCVAIPGANIFKEKWVKLFYNAGIVYVALDPGALPQAERIATVLGKGGVACRLVTMPVKPDDFFVIYGGDKETFERYLGMARKW